MTPSDRWFFDRVAGVYDRVMWGAPRVAVQAGLQLADGPVEVVLDVGGGTGRAVRTITTPERIVIDTSIGMLRRAPAEVGRVLASATQLPVAEGAVDAVIIVDALHHFPEHDRVLGEVFQVLRPGGVLVIREFDRESIRGRLIAFAERLLRFESTFLTAKELHDRLEAAGFEAEILDGGFVCMIAGRKPGAP